MTQALKNSGHQHREQRAVFTDKKSCLELPGAAHVFFKVQKKPLTETAFTFNISDFRPVNLLKF